MGTDMVRGYLVAQALEFVRTRCGTSEREGVEAQLSGQFRSAAAALTPAGWFPRRHMAEVLNAIGAVMTEDTRYERLLACGQFINQRTTNDFTSLVYGILTPELFVRRVPRFWQHEHQGGARFELDAAGTSAGLARLELSGVEGYDHIGVVWLGWMQGALAQMRSGGVTLTQSGWTPTASSPAKIQYELRWS